MRSFAACLVWGWLVLTAVGAAPGPARADWRSQFAAEAQAAFEASGSPGMALVIVEDDAVVLAKGYGRLTSDPDAPAVDLDSVFLLGSTSKAFLAAQFAVLADGSLWPVPADWFWNEAQDRAMGAAAVRTSAHDLGQWLRCNMALGRIGTQQVVSPATMRALQAPKVLISPWQQGHQDSPHWGPVSYGLGWMRFDLSPEPFLFHDGGAMGSGSAVGFAPGAKVGIAVKSNVLAGDGLASDLAWRFYDLYFGTDGSVAPAAGRLLQTLHGLAGSAADVTSTTEAAAAAVTGDTGRNASPARALGSYCGRYTHPAYGLFEVRRAGLGLEIVMGPRRFAAAMTATGGDAFTAELPGYPTGFSMSVPLQFAFPEGGPVGLTTGPILLDPAETFIRAGDVALPLPLLDNP